MRTFKRLNVVRLTDDERKAAKLLAEGFVEITAKPISKRSKARNEVIAPNIKIELTPKAEETSDGQLEQT